MNASVINRRHLVAGGAAAIGVASLSAGIIEALSAKMPCPDPAALAVFDPVAFLADLKAAGCRVHLGLPATVFRPEDDRPSYMISWPPQAGAFQGYCAVMAKWSDPMGACPNHVDLVAARLVELNGWAA